MHIAIVSGEYPPRWGGIGSVVFHLAGHFVELGHEVTIITRSHSDKVPSQEGVNVVPVVKNPNTSLPTLPINETGNPSFATATA